VPVCFFGLLSSNKHQLLENLHLHSTKVTKLKFRNDGKESPFSGYENRKAQNFYFGFKSPMGMIFSPFVYSFCSVIKNFSNQCVLLWRTTWTCVKANRSARAADRRKAATDSANTATTIQSSSSTTPTTTASSVPPPPRKSTYFALIV
jgi:hypothetical protein